MNRKEFIQKTSLGVGSLFFFNPTSVFANSFSEDENSVDKPIVIIGSGYGGAVAALRLCEAGKKFVF